MSGPGLFARMRRGLTRNRARTHPAAEDPRLRGRTYAIPFDDVWTGALWLAQRRRGWTVTLADDQRGVLRAEAVTPVLRFVDDVEVRITLDPDGQTRVDMVSASRTGRGDLGVNPRRIARFLRALDRHLGAGPDRILDVTRRRREPA
ncbi:MAG: DUF1499 domain-containing protein [Gemmatimonadetes bacterium]|nr:MAG: DUF1499 domain-containing protein [Gemmatimonadota bacterium]